MSTLALLDHFKRLTTLELTIIIVDGTFPLVVLSSLSKLPSLANFTLTVLLAHNERLILDAESSDKPIVYSFSNLQNLEVGGGASVALGILKSIYGERLLRVTLRLRLEADSTINALQACIKRCPEMAPHVLFYTINIRGSTRLPRDIFAPLPNSYGQLRSLTIELAVFTIDHFRDLFDRAQAGFLWSALEILKLEIIQYSDFQRNWLEIDRAVPLSSLSMLAASCPRLHTLEFCLYYPFDEEGDRESDILENCIQSSQPTDHKLTHLNIAFFDPFVPVPQPGDILDAITVSRFIDHIFPNVQDVGIPEEYEDVRGAWYAGIRAMMKNYRDVREKKATKGGSIIPNMKTTAD